MNYARLVSIYVDDYDTTTGFQEFHLHFLSLNLPHLQVCNFLQEFSLVDRHKLKQRQTTHKWQITRLDADDPSVCARLYTDELSVDQVRADKSVINLAIQKKNAVLKIQYMN